MFPDRTWDAPAEGASRYLLLDGAQCHAPAQVLDRLPASAIRLFDGVLADGSADASVYLAVLPAELGMRRVLARIAAEADSLGAATFLDSPLPSSELAQRLMRRLDARFPNGKQFLARFYDGRVLPLLAAVLRDPQRQPFLSLGLAWHYVAADHTWQTLPLTALAHDPFVPPLELDSEQRRRLIDDSYPYTLIDHFRLTDRELLDRLPGPDQYRFFRACVALADRYGMRDGGRILMVCTWALLSGEDFHEQPEWRKRLEDFAAGRRSARQIGDEAYPMVEDWEE
ncbi:DUF4123 domain-containing protein [Xanthomonas massiliensis]|uniref:DUF4123 domain-containing protein n=1 Tax=Xanthomonas massiliensis TaxID=1720302 RepID=UPI001C9CFA9B|nr:DUF4123 domain-containing protein [Xanthomonas massiliensis]